MISRRTKNLNYTLKTTNPKTLNILPVDHLIEITTFLQISQVYHMNFEFHDPGKDRYYAGFLEQLSKTWDPGYVKPKYIEELYIFPIF